MYKVAVFLVPLHENLNCWLMIAMVATVLMYQQRTHKTTTVASFDWNTHTWKFSNIKSENINMLSNDKYQAENISKLYYCSPPVYLRRIQSSICKCTAEYLQCTKHHRLSTERCTLESHFMIINMHSTHTSRVAVMNKCPHTYIAQLTLVLTHQVYHHQILR